MIAEREAGKMEDYLSDFTKIKSHDCIDYD